MKVVAGMRFDKLVSIADIGRSADGHRVWSCVCDCGEKVSRQTNNLQARGVKSCGCVQKELQATHGMRGTSEYSIWQSAKARCMNPTSKDFKNYGARGVSMCPEWASSFEEFISHMGMRPEGMTLERIDVNGDYKPGNCKWASSSEQARNKRNSVYVEWRGKTSHLCDIAAEIGISYGAAFMRLKRGKLHDSL